LLIADPAIEILHNQGAAVRQAGDERIIERLCRGDAGARLQSPHVGDVALARAFGTGDHACRMRPAGPAVDELDRSLIRARNKEVLRTECLAMREVEDELARRSSHGMDGSFSLGSGATVGIATRPR